MHFKPLNEYMDELKDKKVINYNNPKCKNCNDCCGILVPISKFEYDDIIGYLRQHQDIVNRIHKQETLIPSEMNKKDFKLILDMTCPFSINKRCVIYKKRPEVCKGFHCDEKLKKEELKIDKILMISNLFDNNRKLKL